MIPILLAPYLFKGGAALVAGLVAFGVYKHIGSAFAERDRLRAENIDFKGQIEAAKRVIKVSEGNTRDCEKDAQSVADLAGRYITEKQAVDTALADALGRTQRVRVITRRTVGASPLPGAASADTSGNNGASEARLSRPDAGDLDERVSRVRDETYKFAAGADKVVKRLTVAQERIAYLEEVCKPE